MSGIADRVHVFKAGQRWWIELGKGYALPAGVGLDQAMYEAMTLHDNPDAIRSVRSEWLMSRCPICARQKQV